MTTVALDRPRSRSCRGECLAAALHREHHDRLLTVDTDTDELLDLLELALTWRELDYSDVAVLGPVDWAGFAGAHEWTFPERASRAFELALDIVGRGSVERCATDIG